MTRDEAMQLANERRLELAKVRRQARAGEVTIGDLLANPPVCIHGLLLVDVVRLGFSGGSGRGGNATLERMGREAVRDGINLLMPAGRASQRSREWVAQRAGWERWRSRRGTKVGAA